MKMSLNGYSKPTPTQVKVFADAVLAATSVLATSAALASFPALGAIIAIVGSVAKLVSKFVSEDEKISEQ